MIHEGIELLSKRFITTVQQQRQKNNCVVVKQKDDLSAIELFYASTLGGSTSNESGVMLEDALFKSDKKQNTVEEKDHVAAVKEKESRERLRNRIDQILPPDERETQPLSRYLYRYVRERATIEHIRIQKDIDKKKDDSVYYASFSFLIDGIYPMVEGLHKKKILRDLRTKYFREVIMTSDFIQWSKADGTKLISEKIFGPVKTSSMYEDNLQRLFLFPPFDIKETQRLNPRGALLAYMAMFAHDHDPLIDIASTNPTTLRGLFNNVLDGGLYEGKTVASLKSPFEVSAVFEGNDIKQFCDRLFLSSYYSIFLTLLNIKAWIADRYPEDRFVVDAKKNFVSVKIPYNEVIFDPKDKTWTFHDKHQKTICYTSDFSTLLNHVQ